MEIICGSYNNMLFGYQIDSDYNERLSFTNDAHAGNVKCLSVSKSGLLASAGTDEIVKIFNLSKRKEIGSMMHLNGSITDLLFHGNSHLFTSCETGEIAICDSKSWIISHVLKHKSVVLSFTIHESGKLLLSSCKDRTLQTWNLITGRRAFVTNLKHEAEIVRFSIDGHLFVTIYTNYINSFMTKDGKLCSQIIAPKRIVSALFIDKDILCIGCEGGFIYFYNISNCQLLHTISTGTVRIKCLNFTTSSHLISVTSDGFILVHLISVKENSIESQLKKSISTSHRWLCVATFEEENKHINKERDEPLNETYSNKKKILDKVKVKKSKLVILNKKNDNAKMTKITKRKGLHNHNDDFNNEDIEFDVYKEDDGSCPSNEEESDEEKSYKDQQRKLKRSLSTQSEPIKKKFKIDNNQTENQKNRKTNFKFHKQRNDENSLMKKNKYKNGNKKYENKSQSITFKDAVEKKFKNSKDRFSKKSVKNFKKNKKSKHSINMKYHLKHKGKK